MSNKKIEEMIEELADAIFPTYYGKEIKIRQGEITENELREILANKENWDWEFNGINTPYFMSFKYKDYEVYGEKNYYSEYGTIFIHKNEKQVLEADWEEIPEEELDWEEYQDQDIDDIDEIAKETRKIAEELEMQKRKKGANVDRLIENSKETAKEKEIEKGKYGQKVEKEEVKKDKDKGLSL